MQFDMSGLCGLSLGLGSGQASEFSAWKMYGEGIGLDRPMSASLRGGRKTPACGQPKTSHTD